MSIKQINGYKVHLNEKLGTGTYGSVYKGQCDKTKMAVAVKVIDKKLIDQDQYMKTALFQQIKIMQSIKNPNILTIIDVMESSSNYYLILELCDGDISDIIKSKKALPQKECINMLTQICNGLLALVTEGIVHRDIKPANVMIKDSVLKIGDFGYAKKIPNQKFKNKSIVGTPLYMPIEILKQQNYTSKCDIWALGFIFYELLHGVTPWTAKSEYELVKNLENKPLQINRKDLSKDTVDFLKKCLAVHEQDRISWNEVFLHPIFQGFFDDKGNNKNFEDKLKQILNDLRFYITSKNLDLDNILKSMGYLNKNTELSYQEYHKFLKNVKPEIKQQESLYIFKKTDTDQSNSISIAQIQKILHKHNISFTSSFKGIPKFERRGKNKSDETFTKVSEEVQAKVHKCFNRLFKIIRKHGITLDKVFSDFNKEKDGKLSEKQFMRMMLKLDKEMQEDQVKQAFNMIDEDGSKTIEPQQLNYYYCRANGMHPD